MKKYFLAMSLTGLLFCTACQVTTPNASPDEKTKVINDSGLNEIDEDLSKGPPPPPPKPPLPPPLFLAYYGNVDGDNEIYLIDVSDPDNIGSSIQVTSNTVSDVKPQWSTDGKLTYLSDSKNVYLVDISDPNNIDDPILVDSSSTYNLYSPSWSPDGTKIAYMKRNLTGYTVKIADVNDTSNISTSSLSYYGSNKTDISWSPDSTKFILASDHLFDDFEIYIIDASSGYETYVTKFYDAAYAPRWSPDGNMIAFYSNKDGDNELYIVDVSDTDNIGDPIQVTNNTVDDNSPEWSLDSTMLTYISHNSRGNSDVYIVDVSDTSNIGTPIQITSDTYTDTEPEWSPGNKYIAYSSTNSRENIDIYMIDVSDTSNIGSRVQVTSDTGNNYLPKWGHLTLQH